MSLRDIAVTVVIFGLLPVCVVKPWIGVLTWTWIGLMNPHKLTWGFAADMPFALMVAVATLIGLVLTREKKPIPWSRELVLLAFLYGYFTFTTWQLWVPEFAWVQGGKEQLEEIIRALNDIQYTGPLSVEWEDARMDREHGAREACEFVKRLDFTPANVAFDAAFSEG